MTNCRHGSGFGSSIACAQCNAELAATLDSPRRFSSITARPMVPCTACGVDREVGSACPWLDCSDPLRDVKMEGVAPRLAAALELALNDDGYVCDLSPDVCGCWPSRARAALRAAGRLP